MTDEEYTDEEYEFLAGYVVDKLVYEAMHDRAPIVRLLEACLNAPPLAWDFHKVCDLLKHMKISFND